MPLPSDSEETNLVYSKGKVLVAENGFVRVQPINESGCSGCSSASGCGTSALAKLFMFRGRKPLIMVNDLHAKTGDTVELSIKQSHLIKHSFMAYGIPLLGLMLFAWVGLTVFKSDLLSSFLGLAGMMGSWWLIGVFYSPEQPRLNKIINEDLEQKC
jgi:sigma-E factor negative regulatory protein RseC